MLRKQKFYTTGLEIGVIGQGTWYLDRGDRKSAVAALRRGIELGMTHIDTAEMYGDAELVIAEAIAGKRDALFLVSKVAEQCIAAWHDCRMRTIPEAAEDREARLLSAALARIISAPKTRWRHSMN
jgi:diketogulonate reductase-like aldo/keto reductase